jgi:hypothetical protein
MTSPPAASPAPPRPPGPAGARAAGTRPAAPAPRPAGETAAAAGPGRGDKARDFKPVLARATPPATPTPTRAAPPLQPAMARGPAPAPTPAIARPAVPGVLQTPALRPWEGQTNAAFRQRIAEAERSAEHANDGYHLRNPSSGALGRYQFLPIALRDIGWMNAEGGWTEAAARHGVTDEASFLATPAAQEAAMSAYLARQEAILDRGGTLGAVGLTIRGLDGREITLSEGALVAAAHRRGAGALARYLSHRTDTPDAPLSPAQRIAFESIEHRLRGFAEVAYASERPGNRMMARRGGPAG